VRASRTQDCPCTAHPYINVRFSFFGVLTPLWRSDLIGRVFSQSGNREGASHSASFGLYLPRAHQHSTLPRLNKYLLLRLGFVSDLQSAFARILYYNPPLSVWHLFPFIHGIVTALDSVSFSLFRYPSFLSASCPSPLASSSREPRKSALSAFPPTTTDFEPACRPSPPNDRCILAPLPAHDAHSTW
jgi:hypothetical protein